MLHLVFLLLFFVEVVVDAVVSCHCSVFIQVVVVAFEVWYFCCYIRISSSLLYK